MSKVFTKGVYNEREYKLGRILSIKYYPRDETVGFKEPPLLSVLRDGRGSEIVYELRNFYGIHDHISCPEDVYLFIEENCRKPFYEADYTFCLESVLAAEFDAEDFVKLKEAALKMQTDLTKEGEKNALLQRGENLNLI
tara:strand:- start:349 stop:765 length:417 start_codon:yes stop_codon:yes gene_type:complete